MPKFHQIVTVSMHPVPVILAFLIPQYVTSALELTPLNKLINRQTCRQCRYFTLVWIQKCVLTEYVPYPSGFFPVLHIFLPWCSFVP